MWRVGHALDMRSRVHLRYKTKYRVSNWAELMMRVFREDVLRCKKCGGRAAVISAIAQPKGVEAILVCLGLAVRAPPPTPARQIPFDL